MTILNIKILGDAAERETYQGRAGGAGGASGDLREGQGVFRVVVKVV